MTQPTCTFVVAGKGTAEERFMVRGLDPAEYDYYSTLVPTIIAGAKKK